MALDGSIPGLLRQAAIEAPKRRFIRWINPADPQAEPLEFTYAAFDRMIRQCIAALEEAGLKAGDRMLFLAENSPAWQALVLAAQSLRIEVAALFSSLGAADILDIACRVQPKAVFVGNADQWAKLQTVLLDLKNPPFIFTTDHSVTVTKPFSSMAFTDILLHEPITEVKFDGKLQALEAEDPFILIFTSGTTGRQKGVRLSQRAAMEAVRAGLEATHITPEDVGLHILPFAHIAGLCAFYVPLIIRGETILCSRREDLQLGFSMAPTYTLLVPLIYERIQKEVMKGIDKKPPWLASLLRRSIRAAMDQSFGEKGGLGSGALAGIARRLVGGALRKKLGGKIRLLGAGGAHSEANLVAFYRGLGFDYLNFYGMSETCGIISLSRSGDRSLKPGAVGKPWAGVELKIEPDGEILVRGRTLMSGYLEADPDAFTDDGYFRTGDLGHLDQDGYLFIKGRKKNIFVLSTGKKVFPEPIELKLRQSLPIADAVLIGDQMAFIAAGLFIPHDELQLLRNNLKSKDLENSLLEKIRSRLKGLSDYELPKQIFIIEGAPYDYPKIVTPTLKIKRKAFARTFSSQIRKIYAPSPPG